MKRIFIHKEFKKVSPRAIRDEELYMKSPKRLKRKIKAVEDEIDELLKD